jgi:Immunoglobulin-like domain of bacterial spore germination
MHMKKFGKHLCILAGLLLCPALLLTACGSTAFSAATTSTGNVSGPATSIMSDRESGCPEKVEHLSYWDRIIGTHGDAKVERVSCGKIMQYPGTQVLVLARHHSVGSQLDVYVYANILAYKPAQFFKLMGLYKGDAKISAVKTVLTAQVDLNSSINKGKPNAQLTLDLFREFKWSDGAGAFEQTAFPGMFPDLTRYQAEAGQEEVNEGAQPWKLDAAQTAKDFATGILQMKSTSAVAVVSGGGLHDLNAVVQVTLPTVAGGGGPPRPIKLTLSRLEANSAGNWEVTAVESENLSITNPRSQERLDSPVTITGSGVAFEGQIGIVQVLDHLYNDIGHSFAMSQNLNSGFGPGTFSTSVTYNASFHGGSQEGIVALFHQG